ncbi:MULTISPECIES: alanine racemase [unclassified Hyphomicrobium]|uniref:alanine racemase n=1 Tax=unclassified Hyphomicrobium TaxID=2619925 RepID=UPI000213E3EF|nr:MULTISPECIES: alanine racemase [unclassified Hyphomicrobium]CCB65261.1 putative alanine racemase (alr-like) [Hyphomicrobium sp. MC1]
MTVNARMPESVARATGTITVDLGCIAANWRALADKVAPARCAAVVKADAYGLGAERVIATLARAGCTAFFIATPGEAETARRIAPDADIYALDGLVGNTAAAFAHLAVKPVLSTLDDVVAWSALCRARGERLPAAFHIDTGLHRLGLPVRDVRRLVAEPSMMAGIELDLVMSHLASADNPRDPKNREQLLTFETLSALFPGVARSLAASDGLMLGPSYHFDLVRPGYALYGGQASQIAPAPVHAAVTVAARILAVADVAPGETVGYSATWRAKRPSRIATIAAGYADGVPRNASAPDGRPGGHVLISGHLAPIVGRISMDLITVDVTDLPDGAAMPGEFAKLIAEGLTIEDAGFSAGTIGYEILTRLGNRFTRLYLDENP